MSIFILSTAAGLMLLASPLDAQAPVTLADGGKVYSQSCGRCHNPRAPNERSDREWDVIVAHMRTRADLSGRETRAVLLFLQTTNGMDGSGGGVASSVQANSPVDMGQKLLEEKACIACHSVGKHKSGVLGPDLNTVFERRSEEWIMQKLIDPTTDAPTTVMPQMNLTQPEREAILAYLRSVSKK